MANSRVAQRLVILLLLSSILTIIPTASSQQFSTVTSLLTTLVTQTTIHSIVSFSTTTSTGTGIVTFTESYYGTATAAPCKLVLLGTFNSSGLMHFEYSVNGQTTLYILSGVSRSAMTELRTATMLAGCSSIVSLFGLPSYTRLIMGSGSESFDLNLPPADNPYIYAIITPASQAVPNGSLAISPLSATNTIALSYTTTSTELFTIASTVGSLSSIELRPYGGGAWIGLGIFALIILFVLYLLHRRRGAHTNPALTFQSRCVDSSSAAYWA